MKLHLPKLLTVALLAAFTTVGFTLTQAQADQELSVTTPSGQQLESKNSGINWSEDTGNLTSWALTFNFYENRDLGAYDLFGTNGGDGAKGDVLKTTAAGAITLTSGGSTISSGDGSFTKQNQVAVTLSYKADYNQFGTSLNSGTYTLKVGEGEAVTLAVTNDSNSTFIKNGNTRLWTNGGNEKFYNIALTQLDNNIIEVTASQWKGQSGANEWVSSNFQPEFSTGKDVVFDATGYNTVVVKDAVQAGVVTVSGAAYTFNIQSTGSLSATEVNVGDGGSATLTGEGTYILPSGSTSLGSVSLGEGWAGAVRISNVSSTGNNTHLENLFRGNSWVEVNGIKGGFLPQWNGGNLAANIMLTNPDGGVAWKWSDGSSSGETLITFSGTWKGAGTFFKDTNDKRQGYKYTGNISDWTGDFRAKATNSNAVTKLEFAGSANDVKIANIKNEGVSALNVVLSTGSTMSVASNISKTSTGAVNISLTNSTAATLSGTVVADSLTIDSGSSLTNTGALTINGTITFGANAIENNGTGSITLGNDVIFNIAGLTDESNKYTLFSGTGDKIDLSSHGYTAANIAGVTTAGRTWTFNNDGTISYAVSAAQIWTGGSTGDWDYESNNWGTPGAPFTSGSSAQFDSSANVTLVDAIVADSIIVSSGAEVNLIAGEGSSLQAQAVEVGGTLTTGMTVTGLTAYNVSEGGVWNINANQTLGSGTKAGIINVGSGARVDITENGLSVVDGMTNHGTVALALTGVSKLTMNSASDGTVELSGGTLDYRSELGTQDIKLTGTKLLFGNNAGSVIDTVFDHNIVLGSATTIQVYGTSQHKSVTIKGTITGSGYELIKDDGNQTTTFEGKVTVNKFTTGDSSTGTTVIKNGAEIGNNLSPRKGTLEIHGDVSVGHELDLSSNGACTATVKIAADGAATVKDGMWMGKSAHVELLEGGKLALTNAGLSLVGRNGGGSVTTTADNGQYGVGNTTFTISGADVTATKAVTIGNKLTNSSISTGANAVTLSNTGNTLMGGTVAEGGSLSIAGGGLVGTAIANNGTLTFTGDITATGFTVTKGASGLVDVNGATNTGNGFETTSGDSITIANNAETATLTPNGYKVTQDSVEYTIQADGTAVTAGSSTKYSTYYQTNGEVSTSDIAAAAASHQGLFTSAYVSGTGTLKVDSGVGIVAAAGGEVVFSGEGATDMLYVSDDAKVTGLTDFSVMTIDATKTATMDADIVAGDVFFSTVDGGVQVTNTSTDTPITYSINEESAQVTADTMTVGGTEEVVVSNSLLVGEIINNSTENLIVMGNVEDDVTLNAAGGGILLAGQTTNTVSVVNLDIAAGKTVTVMDGDMVEGTVTVTDTLTGGDATLLANLTLVDGTTLDVNGGGTHALTLGSELTISLTNGGLVNLDDDTLLALNNLGDGETLNLIVSVDSVLDALTYGADYEGMSYDELFSRTGRQGVELLGNYTVYAQGDAFGVTKQGAVPEPTTGTLSLLALMALAARRRRK